MMRFKSDKGESRASSKVIFWLFLFCTYMRSSTAASCFIVVMDVLDVICSVAKPIRAEATSLLVNSGLWKRLKNQYHAVACCGFVAINQ